MGDAAVLQSLAQRQAAKAKPSGKMGQVENGRIVANTRPNSTMDVEKRGVRLRCSVVLWFCSSGAL